MEMTQEEVQEIVDKAIEKGFEYYRKGEDESAESIFKQILCVDQDNCVALQLLGLLESKKPGMTEEALKKLKRAEELDPTNADVHNNLGLVYSWADNKNADLAEMHYKKAIELNPKMMHFYSNFGILLKSLDRLQEAEDTMLLALKHDNNSSSTHFNYATLLGELKKPEEAEVHYKKAIEIDPKFASAHYNLATVYLNNGDLENGWKEYEWRWEVYPQFKRIYTRFPDEKRWNGEEIEGKRFFLYAEQGMGDTIQFARFVKLLKGASNIVLEEHSDLIRVMKTLEGQNSIQDYGEKIEEFDYHASIVSLPYLLNLNKIEDIPNEPYLKCNYDLMPKMSILQDKHWKKYDGLKKIGIIWAGNPVHRHDVWRSTHLKNFKKLEIPGVKLFSLQKDVRVRFHPGFGEVDFTEGSEGMSVVDLKDFMIDYNATAALIDRMDLIVAVDTATAHLAAAMGKPVWLLVAHHNDWRWLKEGKKSYWYPSVTIFRQKEHGKWEPVFDELREELNTNTLLK